MDVAEVFNPGPFPTQILTIPAKNLTSACKISSTTTNPPTLPPKPLLIILPSQPGEYPLLILLHGYLLLNNFYTQLLTHIASHGYITIAPQMYMVAGPDSTPEVADVAAIIDWLPAGFSNHLPENVKPDFGKLAVAGHSRGGKVAFGTAVKRAKMTSPLLGYKAVVGIDPVDGMGSGQQTPPPVLSYEDHSFQLAGIPSLVIGSGLGSVKRNPLFPPCAPAGVNHRDFFRECRAPAYHLVASEYGHNDFLDDKTGGVRGRTTYCLCKDGVAREPMRRFSGGAIVAFLNAWLRDDSVALEDIVAHPERAPVQLETPERYV